MSAGLTILYEDQRGEAKGFGLHTLVKACVFDLVNGERHRVEGTLRDARPLKGVQNVLRACRADFELIAADGRSVIAVIDNDAIRHHLELPRGATRERVEQEIKRGCASPDRLFVALIEENTESILEAAGACDPGLDGDRLRRAVEHKDLLERDAIFGEISRERARPVRDCVLAQVKSLQALVRLVESLLTPRAKPTPTDERGAAPAKGKRARR